MEILDEADIRHKMGFVAREGLLVAIVLTILPFFILWALIKLLPPWLETHSLDMPHIATAHGDD